MEMWIAFFPADQPMKWEKFQRLPKCWQAEYLNRVIGRFGATDPCLADMFGVHVNTLARARKLLGVDPGGGRMRTKDKKAWDAWLADTDSAEDLSFIKAICESARAIPDTEVTYELI